MNHTFCCSAFQEVRYSSVEEGKIMPYREEASLVLYRMASAQDFLPILAAIPEVKNHFPKCLSFCCAAVLVCCIDACIVIDLQTLLSLYYDEHVILFLAN